MTTSPQHSAADVGHVGPESPNLSEDGYQQSDDSDENRPQNSKARLPSRRQKLPGRIKSADAVKWEMSLVVVEQQARKHVGTNVVFPGDVPDAQIDAGMYH
jgi:hypothetical protein